MIKVIFHQAHVKKLPNVLADVELHFEGGMLDGLRLKGFTVWKSKKLDGTVTLTFPARPYKDKQYWLLRSIDEGDQSPLYRLRTTILAEYEQWLRRDT